MMFKVLAVEHPDIRVLNYDPGLVNTDMYGYLSSSVVDPRTADYLAGVENDGMLLSAEETADVLWKTLEQDVFESGARVDYYGQVSQ